MLTERNRRLCRELYSDLVALRQEYLRTVASLWQTEGTEARNELCQRLAGLQMDISAEHKRIEAAHQKLRQPLPHDENRVAPTTFGNVYAQTEEYAYERYGVDTVLFWTRLRRLLNESEETTVHAAQLTAQKTMLDLTINFAFLAGFYAIEAFVLWLWSLIMLAPANVLLLWAALGAVLSLAFYNASVSAVRLSGELIKTSFDYHRGLVLKSFGLAKPDDLYMEQARSTQPPPYAPHRHWPEVMLLLIHNYHCRSYWRVDFNKVILIR